MPYKEPPPLSLSSSMIQNHATSPNNLLLSSSDVQSSGTGHEKANHVFVLCNSRCKYDINLKHYKNILYTKYTNLYHHLIFKSKLISSKLFHNFIHTFSILCCVSTLLGKLSAIWLSVASLVINSTNQNESFMCLPSYKFRLKCFGIYLQY